MAKVEKRQINLYINGREVKNTIKEISGEYKKSLNQLNKMTRGSEEYNEKVKEIKELKTHLNEHNRLLGRTSSKWSSLKGLLPTVGFAALGATVMSVGKKIFNLTIEATQLEKRFETVFGNSKNVVTEAADVMSDKMGLTARQFRDAATGVGDLMIPLGFSRKKAAELSVEMIGLSGALNEWTGGTMGATEVSDILTKAMLGETEQLKSLGIAVSLESDEYKTLVKEKIKAGNVTKEQAKALAMMEMVQRKSIDAQNAYAAGGNKLLEIKNKLIVSYERLKEKASDLFRVTKVDDLKKQKEYVNTLVAELMTLNTTQERKKKIYNELRRINPDVVKGISLEKIELGKLKDNLSKYNESMVQKIMLENLTDEAKKKATVVAEKQLEIGKAKQTLLHSILMIDKDIALSSLNYSEKKTKALELETKLRKDVKDAYTEWRNLEDGEEKKAANLRRQKAVDLEQVFIRNKGQIQDTYETIEQGETELKLLKKKQSETASLAEELKKIVGIKPEEDTTITPTIDTSKIVFKPIKLISDEDIDKEIEKDIDKEIEAWIKGQDKLRGIQKRYHLDQEDNLKTDVLAQVQSLYDQQLIDEEQFQEAKKAIEDNFISQKIENELERQILNEESNLLDLENEEISWEDKLAREEERYNQEQAIEDLRHQQDIEKARRNKMTAEKVELEHKKRLGKIDEKHLKNKQKISAEEEALQHGRLEVAQSVLGGLATVFGRESALGKAALIAKQGVALAETIMSLGVGSAKTAAVGFPQNIPLLAAFLGQTAGLIGTIKGAVSGDDGPGFEDGGFTRKDTSNKKVAGVVHANEWVATASSVSDPIIGSIIKDLNDYQTGINVPDWIENFGGMPNFEEAVPAVKMFNVGGFTSQESSMPPPSSQGLNFVDDSKLDVLISQNDKLLEYLSDPENRRSYVSVDELNNVNNEIYDLYNMGSVK
jgi:hypothetical protein